MSDDYYIDDNCDYCDYCGLTCTVNMKKYSNNQEYISECINELVNSGQYHSNIKILDESVEPNDIMYLCEFASKYVWDYRYVTRE
jgi:hypothetical protein